MYVKRIPISNRACLLSSCLAYKGLKWYDLSFSYAKLSGIKENIVPFTRDGTILFFKLFKINHLTLHLKHFFCLILSLKKNPEIQTSCLIFLEKNLYNDMTNKKYIFENNRMIY